MSKQQKQEEEVAEARLAALRLRVRNTQEIMRAIDENADADYLHFLSTASYFTAGGDPAYIAKIDDEIYQMGHRDGGEDPLAAIKERNANILLRRKTEKLRRQIEEVKDGLGRKGRE